VRRILITDGCGFAGSNIAVHLAASFVDVRIVCMDNLYRKAQRVAIAKPRNPLSSW